jgi:oligogalacturonide lyase
MEVFQAMKLPLVRFLALLLPCAALAVLHSHAGLELPAEWIDSDTGHRVIRLSTEPGSSSLYFHQNTYTPQGDRLIFDTPSGIAMVDLATLGIKPVEIEIVVPGGRAVATARKTREVYFIRVAGSGSRSGALLAANLDTREVREVKYARGSTINCDETFSVATITQEDPTGKTPRSAPRIIKPQIERMFPGKKLEELTPEQRYAVNKEDGLAARLPNPSCQAFVFTNLKTGEQKIVGYQYAWLNHLQFSPTDPNLLLYCHEGTWHEVDRIWTIRTDGSEQRLMHKRTMDMEIAGHEFWGYDGKTIWFDLQTPRSEQFWLAGVNLSTGHESRYKLERDWWSIHFNVSRDGKIFAGDGGDPTQVAFARDGMWINLFRSQPDGTIQRERLVNMSKHNYVTGKGGVEPNVTITPDGKWVVFTGNMFGARHVYAVEIARAK